MISVSKVSKVIKLVKDRDEVISEEYKYGISDKFLTDYLKSLDYEELLDLLTIRYLGCCKDCNQNDYAANFGKYKARIGCYDYSKNSAIHSLTMIEEIPLSESLAKGLNIISDTI